MKFYLFPPGKQMQAKKMILKVLSWWWRAAGLPHTVYDQTLPAVFAARKGAGGKTSVTRHPAKQTLPGPCKFPYPKHKGFPLFWMMGPPGIPDLLRGQGWGLHLHSCYRRRCWQCFCDWHSIMLLFPCSLSQQQESRSGGVQGSC